MIVFHFGIHSFFRNGLLSKMDEINLIQQGFWIGMDRVCNMKWMYTKYPGSLSKGNC